MSKWETVRLDQILYETITGEWGQECNNEFGVKVLRTTNFTNKGIIDYSNIAIREIPVNKIEKKKLLPCDINNLNVTVCKINGKYKIYENILNCILILFINISINSIMNMINNIGINISV